MDEKNASYPDQVVDRCHKCGYLMVEFYSAHVRGLQGLTCANSQCEVSELSKNTHIQHPIKCYIRPAILQN